MSLPFVAAGLGGLALSAGANLYTQRMSRALYRRQINAYEQLGAGYNRYLARMGRKANPWRYYERFGGRIDSARTNLINSRIGSIGTAGGTLGAGLMMAGKTRKWI